MLGMEQVDEHCGRSTMIHGRSQISKLSHTLLVSGRNIQVHLAYSILRRLQPSFRHKLGCSGLQAGSSSVYELVDASSRMDQLTVTVGQKSVTYISWAGLISYEEGMSNKTVKSRRTYCDSASNFAHQPCYIKDKKLTGKTTVLLTGMAADGSFGVNLKLFFVWHFPFREEFL